MERCYLVEVFLKFKRLGVDENEERYLFINSNVNIFYFFKEKVFNCFGFFERFDND